MPSSPVTGRVDGRKTEPHKKLVATRGDFSPVLETRSSVRLSSESLRFGSYLSEPLRETYNPGGLGMRPTLPNISLSSGFPWVPLIRPSHGSPLGPVTGVTVPTRGALTQPVFPGKRLDLR